MSGYIGFKRQDVAFPLATVSSAGLMSSADKTALVSIDTAQEIVDLVKNNGATSANTTNSLIVRDVDGNFAANTVSLTSIKVNNVVIDDTTAVSLATTAQAVLDIMPINTARSFKYTIQATTATEYQVTEAMIIHNDTESFISEVGVMYTGANALISLSTDVNSGNIRLLVIPANADTTIKFSKTQFS